MTLPAEYLAQHELQQLSGYRRAKAQAAWLRARGIPFRDNGRHIVVRREQANAWVEGRPVEAVSFQEPDLSCVR